VQSEAPHNIAPQGSKMAVLVTRPHPDNEATAARLRSRGFEALLAPMLRFEPMSPSDDLAADYVGVLATSANALRAIDRQLAQSALLGLPLFAVGDHTAATARSLGFAEVISAEGDAQALRDRVLGATQLKKNGALLYLAGADRARDLGSELAAYGRDVVTVTTYRMVALPHLPHEVCEAFVANAVEAVLHYSKASARAFLEAARSDGVEISALSVLQGCLSDNVALALREAGASQVQVAASADENALFAALERALRS
jgi:uroporphyrinogen-III synthase